MILLAHPYFLRDDAKQLARMKSNPRLATLLAAAVLHDEVRDGADEARWLDLGEAAAAHRSAHPVGIGESEH